MFVGCVAEALPTASQSSETIWRKLFNDTVSDPASLALEGVSLVRKEMRMLVITVDLVPGGYAPMRRTIAVMSVSNISDLAEISDYRIEASETGNPLAGTPPRTVRCLIHGHARAQSVWALLAKASEEIMRADPSNSSDVG